MPVFLLSNSTDEHLTQRLDVLIESLGTELPAITLGILPTEAKNLSVTKDRHFVVYGLNDFFSDNFRGINPIRKVPDILSFKGRIEGVENYTVLNLLQANADQLTHFVDVFKDYATLDDLLRINLIFVTNHNSSNAINVALLPSLLIRGTDHGRVPWVEYLVLLSSGTWLGRTIFRFGIFGRNIYRRIAREM